MVMVSRFVHPPKMFVPTLSTLLGMVISVSPVQP